MRREVGALEQDRADVGMARDQPLRRRNNLRLARRDAVVARLLVDRASGTRHPARRPRPACRPARPQRRNAPA